MNKLGYLFLSLSTPMLFLASCQKNEGAIKAEITTLTESVYASVTIQAEDLYNVHSAVSGIINEVLVEEGDIVRYQSPLIQITSTSPELNLHNARLALDLAKRNYEGRANLLNEIRDEIVIAKLKLENDSINFIKQRNLWLKNIGTQNTFEHKELAFLTSKGNLQLLNSRLSRTEQNLLTVWQEAQNNYRNAQHTQNDYTIKSRMEGRVYEVLKEPGEMITPQEPIALIGSADRFTIKLEIDEVDITKVDKGQKVVVSLDAYSGQVFNAFISHIYPRKNMATQTFRLEANFIKPPEKLFSGLSGEANIVIRVKERVLVIPRSYLTENDKVNTDEGLVQVKIGLQSLEHIEILSGIDSVTNLYLPKK